MKKGIMSLGAYPPYHYLTRTALGQAWGGKGGKRDHGRRGRHGLLPLC